MNALIELKCPHCEHQLSIAPKYAGKRGRCKHCRGEIFVPVIQPTSSLGFNSERESVEEPSQRTASPTLPQHEAQQPQKLKMWHVLLVAVAVLLLIIGALQDPPSTGHEVSKASAPLPTHKVSTSLPAYKVIQSEDYLDYKISLDVRITEPDINLPGPEKLARLSKKLYADYGGKKYERMFIGYYLPGMEVGDSYWATGHHNPDLEVRINGISPELAMKARQSRAKLKPGEKLMSRSLFKNLAFPSIFTIVQKGNDYILRREFEGGDVSEYFLDVRNINGRTCYFKRGSTTSEYYVIGAHGNLEIWDIEEGLGATGEIIGEAKGIQRVRLELKQVSLVQDMSYSDVCEIIGREGTKLGALTGPDGSQKTKYNWSNEEGSLTASFQDNTLKKWDYD